VQSTLRASMDDRVTTVEYAEVAAALSRANSYPSAQARTARYREEFDSKNEVIDGEMFG